MSIQIKNRDFKIDVLKTIGTLLVILAHVNPPYWLYNIRTFDVCMLVFASGLTLKPLQAGLSQYFLYLKKRFFRLIVPAWIFTAIFYTLSYFMSLRNPRWDFQITDCIKSFIFIGGIGMLWIIRVYFTLAIVSPIVVGLSDNRFYRKFWYAFITLALAINEILAVLSDKIPGKLLQDVFKGMVVYTLGYAVVEIIAIQTKYTKSRYILLLLFPMLILYWAIYGFNTLPQDYKYPPQAIYILYGMVCSLIIWCAVKYLHNRFKGFDNVICSKAKQAIVWISENSLWIFFWHIIPINVIGKENLQFNAFISYIFALGFSVSMVIIQNAIKRLIRTKAIKSVKEL